MNELTKEVVPEDVISDTVRQLGNQRMAETFREVEKNLAFEAFASENIKKRLEEHKKLKKIVNMPAVRKVVGQVLEDIIERQTVMFSSLPMRSSDSEDYEHAVDATVLAILLARHFRYEYQELRTPGTASIVHDIGKMAFSRLRSKKPSELSADEKMVVREHPIYSKMILEASEPEAFVEQAVVMQHHEQDDGRGYPQGLKGIGLPPKKERAKDQGYIHRHAEILAVANIYDNLVTGTYDGQVYTPEEAITAIVIWIRPVWRFTSSRNARTSDAFSGSSTCARPRIDAVALLMWWATVIISRVGGYAAPGRMISMLRRIHEPSRLSRIVSGRRRIEASETSDAPSPAAAASANTNPYSVASAIAPNRNAVTMLPRSIIPVISATALPAFSCGARL